MRPRLRSACTLAAAAATAVLLLGGCGSDDDWSEPHAASSPVGDLGAGFSDPEAPPTPEATITPQPGSWDDVHPSDGYRVVLVTAGDDRPTETLVDAVTSWADDEDVSLKTLAATHPEQYIDTIDKAITMKPDLVISAGNDLIDPMTTVSAHYLDQQFLVVGAELAEPTVNVTAADWTGASFRGAELGMSSAYDPSTFTPERAARALRAGVAAVLHDLTGIVIWID